MGVYSRRFLVALGTPGALWVSVFIAFSMYAMLAVALGKVDPLLYAPVPAWNPIDWDTGYISAALTELKPTDGVFWTVFIRTVEYVALALVGCLVIGYPVAYYLALYAGRTKNLILLLLVVPFLVSYMLRMMAWIGLLAPDGYVNRILVDLHLAGQPVQWLDGRPSSVVWALIYGYVPYFILPLYVALDRLDKRYLEAARDLGAGSVRTFVHVTLPLSAQGILAGAVIIMLPMFGDYYTNALISGSPKTSMIGNQINLYVQGGAQQPLGAALAILLVAFLSLLLSYYLRVSSRGTENPLQ